MKVIKPRVACIFKVEAETLLTFMYACMHKYKPVDAKPCGASQTILSEYRDAGITLLSAILDEYGDA